jgi:hypothetical protein
MAKLARHPASQGRNEAEANLITLNSKQSRKSLTQ